MKLFDLSIRYKIPLWGAILILIAAGAVSASLMLDAWDELEEDMLITAQSISTALEPVLAQSLREDDVWRAYEALAGSARAGPHAQSIPAEMIVLADSVQNVFAASDPRAARLLTPIAEIGPDYAKLSRLLAEDLAPGTRLLDIAGAQQLFFATPILLGGSRLGTLVIAVARSSVLPRFYALALHGLVGGLVVLGVLLPINWVWGQRMASPLVKLTDAMAGLPERGHASARLEVREYPYHDEIGRLFAVYDRMLAEMQAKDELARQVVQSERLAAVGQLASGVAHEINNPLGGMLTAIDTLRLRAITDPLTEKTVSLIERGLLQIKETVGALLVQSRVRGADLTARDVEDVRMLIAPQVHAKGVRIEWRNQVAGTVSLPGSMIRQVLINLLLNAVQAARVDGRVACDALSDGRALRLEVRNDGALLPDERIARLFEPFSPSTGGGHGLGLWVTYQIVHQLGGQIAADRVDGQMRFLVEIPLQESP